MALDFQRQWIEFFLLFLEETRPLAFLAEGLSYEMRMQSFQLAE